MRGGKGGWATAPPPPPFLELFRPHWDINQGLWWVQKRIIVLPMGSLAYHLVFGEERAEPVLQCCLWEAAAFISQQCALSYQCCMSTNYFNPGSVQILPEVRSSYFRIYHNNIYTALVLSTTSHCNDDPFPFRFVSFRFVPFRSGFYH